MNEQATGTIVADYDLPHPPDKVWRALTEAELVSAWLMPTDIKPVVGHTFHFQARPAPGFDGIAHCEVLAVEPGRMISYSWRGGSPDVVGYGQFIDTVVTWVLTPIDESRGTHVHLEHSGFTKENDLVRQFMSGGWKSTTHERMEQVLAEIA